VDVRHLGGGKGKGSFVGDLRHLAENREQLRHRLAGEFCTVADPVGEVTFGTSVGLQ